VDFMGQQAPLNSIPDLEPLVGGLRRRVEAALASARDPDTLEGLECVIYSKSETEWGIRFEGTHEAVQYAMDLVGDLKQPAKAN
jgi:hypothetical protein